MNTSHHPPASKRVLAIHDLSGFGHTSLLAAIPILYRMGCEVAVMPSVLLSTNTDYPDYNALNTTSFMMHAFEHWCSLGLSFDGIYTGFLGEEEQVEIIMDYIPQLKSGNSPVLVDPVLGDNGKLYGCYNSSMIKAMCKLISISDIITPNYTEAALLLNKLCLDIPSEGEMNGWCHELALMGPKQVIITSVPCSDKDRIRVSYYDGDRDSYLEMGCSRIPAEFPGTGDCFSSLLMGGIMQGFSVIEAVASTIRYLHDAILASKSLVRDYRTGIALSAVLKTDPLSYFV